jgi:hypothetical protein
MDAVYDQDKAAAAVRDWTSAGVPLFCFDLSNATDRMPLGLQTAILGSLLGSQSQAADWAGVLTDRDYFTDSGKALRYATGQPMGAKSSFVVFDLTHHVIVQMAALRSGYETTFTDYVIIGDDIAIADAGVATQYSNIMSELGVSINLSKSILHGDSLLPAGEVAKRLFISGYEMSVLPVKLLARLPRFGKLGVVVQAFISSRLGVKPDESLLSFILSGMDQDSSETLIRLNAVDHGIVGLPGTTGPLTENMNIAHWSPSVVLSNTDVLDAYTFTVISEQLKRLESLIRVAEGVEAAMKRVPGDEAFKVLEHVIAGVHWKAVDSENAVDILSGGYRSPMLEASMDEANRIGAVLSGLRAGTISVPRAARLGLLDSLRNSVWTKLDSTSEERAQISYSVFLASLNNLGRIVDAPSKDSKGLPMTRTLEFTIPILTLSRSYTVYWRLGGGVYVNMVRSRVNTDHVSSVANTKALSAKIIPLRRNKPASR